MNTDIKNMETITTNPGLQHLVEKIFWNLNSEHLKNCELINQSCKQILQNPLFWLKKFRKLSKDNQKNWMKDISFMKNSEKRNAIISYLQWNLKKGVVDIQCCSSPVVQDDFRSRILECCKKEESSDESIEMVKILAPLTDNPNAPDEDGDTPINWAAYKGHTEMVKILAPLTDNPNAPDEDGDTPINWAA